MASVRTFYIAAFSIPLKIGDLAIFLTCIYIFTYYMSPYISMFLPRSSLIHSRPDANPDANPDASTLYGVTVLLSMPLSVTSDISDISGVAPVLRLL